jgi:hypothetical protein
MWASCSILPSSVTLGSAPQNATATINTVTSVASMLDAPPGDPRSQSHTEFCLLLPAVIFLWRTRASRHRGRRAAYPVAWAIVSAIVLLGASGCGGAPAANTANSGLRYTPSGSYQYQVTASSTGGSAQITQTVTLNLIVQ